MLVVLAVIFTLYLSQAARPSGPSCLHPTDCVETGPRTVRTAPPVAHRRSRRSIRPRRTTPQLALLPRDLLRCERSPSSLPTSLADAPLDVLTFAAFYRTAAVLSATNWRAPDQIPEVKRRRGM